AFRNQGDTTARNVVITDQLPAAIEYIPNSLALNDGPLSDALDADEGAISNGKIEIRLATVNPAEAFRVTFRARLAGPIAGGMGVVNNAAFTADNAPPVRSVDATV